MKFSHLPEDVFFLIIRKCSIKDMINIICTCKNYKFIMDIDNEILEIAPHRCSNKLLLDDLYFSYSHGKSFNKIITDVHFTISDFEYILYQGGNIRDYETRKYIIITINNLGNYIVYTFGEVLDHREVSPGYHGYDYDDEDKYLLNNKSQYNSLKEMYFEYIYMLYQLKKDIINTISKI